MVAVPGTQNSQGPDQKPSPVETSAQVTATWKTGDPLSLRAAATINLWLGKGQATQFSQSASLERGAHTFQCRMLPTRGHQLGFLSTSCFSQYLFPPPPPLCVSNTPPYLGPCVRSTASQKTAPWARPCCPVTRGSECVFWVLSGTKPQYLPRGRTHVLGDQHVEGGRVLAF